MSENLGNLKPSEIELPQQLPALECEWLLGLLAKRGVATAEWAANIRRLSIQYDADLCDAVFQRLRYLRG